MSEVEKQKLRLYADFNSCIDDHRGIWCWILLHNGKHLDDVASSLDCYDGMPVILYNDDIEDREYEAILGHNSRPGWDDRWMALVEENELLTLRKSVADFGV